jgi:hypothetical protein
MGHESTMTPRHLSPSEVETIAREIFHKEMIRAKLISEDGIRLIAEAVFKREIEPTSADIQAVRDELGNVSDRLNRVDTKVGETKNMILRLHSFGEGQPGFFEERAKQDDTRWQRLDINMDRLDDNLHRFGIVTEANKIIDAKKEKRRKTVAEWSRWGVPILAGALGASFWRLMQNYALHGGHLPMWLMHVTKILAK